MPSWGIRLGTGQLITDEERSWDELARPELVGGQWLYLAAPGAEEMLLYAGARVHVLKAPGPRGRFFRERRGRTGLDGTTELLYHAMGYLAPDGAQIRIEVDPRGHSTTRLIPPPPDA